MSSPSDQSDRHTESDSSYRDTTVVKTSISAKQVMSNKRMTQRQIIYPQIEKAIEFTNDEFWKTKLMLAARGKLPRGFSCRGDCIYFKKKNKISSIQLPTEPAQIVRIFIEFMQSKGIYSDLDTESRIQHAEYAGTSTNSTPTNWSQVPKNSRASYVTRYVTDIAQTYNLSPEQTKSLQNSIFLGIKFKIFNKNSIVLDENGISFIHGIVVDNESNLYIIDKNLWNSACNVLSNKYQEPDVLNLHPTHVPDPINCHSRIKIIRSEYDKMQRTCIKAANNRTQKITAPPDTMVVLLVE